MIRVPGRDGTIVVFRNEEERALAIRVIASARDSYLDPSIDETMPKCGRFCERCNPGMSHSRSSSESTFSTMGTIPLSRTTSRTLSRNQSRESTVLSRTSSVTRCSYPVIEAEDICFVLTEEPDAMEYPAEAPRMSIADFDSINPDVEWYTEFMRGKM